MDTAIKFLYLSEPDMIRAGVTDMDACVEAMEDLLLTLHKGDYVMGGKNHNSHGCMVTFPDDPEFDGMPKNAEDRRFMAMPAYLGGRYQMAGMKWYGSNMGTFGHYDSHIILATHSGILTRIKSTSASALTSPLIRRSPTTLNYFRIPSFGTLFSPVEFSAQGHSTSELLRTLLMSGCF